MKEIQGFIKMKEINLDNIKVDSIVFSKWYGEYVVKNITSNKIIIYSKSKNKEVEFEYPNAFYNCYLHIIDETNSPLESSKSEEKIFDESNEEKEITSVELGEDEIEPVELSEEETRIRPLKNRRISVPEVKKDYSYSADDILNKLVVKSDNIQGSIESYTDHGKNKEGRIEVNFNGDKITYVYPSCFVNENLKFVNEEDSILISKDIDIYKDNTDEAIKNRKEEREEKGKILNNLSQYLSCIEKCESVEDFCRLYRGAVYQEIKFLKTKGERRYKLTDGKEVSIAGNKYIYSFESEDELNLLPDTDIRINDCKDFNGKVISCEDNTIMFSSEKLNKNMLKGILISYNNWFIMEQLDKRLYELSKNYNRIVKQLVCGNTEITGNSNLQFGQEKAIEMACNNPITYIWGPPGTGKTYTLANIVVKLLSQGKRVLMLSHSNVSVDGAIIEVENHLSNYDTGEIIRYGYPKDKSLLNSENLLNSYNLALRKNAKLKDKQKDLLEEKAELNNKIEIYNDIINGKIKAIKNYEDVEEKLYITNKCIVYIETELNGIRAKIKTDEEEIVKSAKFVATTLSKAVCDSVIYKQKFDAVIIDEVSMAYTPQVIFAANIATEHFCCIGDFNQLSPIVQNKGKDNANDNILKSDIFEYCGDLNNMVILNEQRRMHKDIAKFISSNMYFNLLESHDSVEERNKITKCEPFADKAITYVDIHSLKSAAKLVGFSHYNIISLLVTVKIAQKALKKNDVTVGIITPYSEQAKLLNATLRVLLSEDKKDRVTCATVHQFQGSQRDIIIYDAVDAKGKIKHPGFLITASNKNNRNVSNRLFNVAMTRAKGKFIVVADREFIDSGLTKGETEGTEKFKSLFFTLSRHAENNELIVDAKDLDFLADDVSGENFITFCSNKEATKALKKDIQSSKNIRVDIPGKISNKTLTEIYIKYRLNNRVDVQVSIDQYFNKGIDYNSQVNKKDYILINKTIVDDDIIWLGYNCTKYDNDLCWRIKNQQFIKKIENM